MYKQNSPRSAGSKRCSLIKGYSFAMQPLIGQIIASSFQFRNSELSKKKKKEFWS